MTRKRKTRPWGAVRQKVLRHLASQRAVLEDLQLNMDHLDEVPAWMTHAVQRALTMNRSMLELMQSSPTGQSLMATGPTPEQQRSEAVAHELPMPGEYIHWHLPTSAYDVCPHCGHQTLYDVRPNERHCTSCQAVHRLHLSVNKWIRRKQGLLMPPRRRNKREGQATDVPQEGQPCSVKGCPHPHYRRGLCRPHYFRDWERRREEDPTTPMCLVEGCPKKARTKGFCQKHYRQITRHGQVLDLPPPGAERQCQEAGCVEPVLAKDLCAYHYEHKRWLRRKEEQKEKERKEQEKKDEK